ncbi:MAG: potassium transporter [Betaproteobacteria bacterium]|nr:MAG: potassium transporter [Betaproteobacteria bacterium]
MNSALALLVIVLAASVLSVGICRRLGLPSLLGYLAVGMLLGPHAFKLIPDSAQARAIAEYGVVFLMFSIGLEFSLPQFRAMRRLVLGLGGAQYALTLLLFAGIAMALTQSLATAIVLGAALAMSSTAIGIKLLAERNELSAPVSRPVIGVLLFQDLAVVPLLILLPTLGDGGAMTMTEIGWVVLKVVVLLGVLLKFGQPVLRAWFRIVAQRKTTELFMLNVLLVTLLLAWLCHLAELPHALGAFVAGMLIAETEYKLQVEDDIRPFRDVLLGMFFISVGMQLDGPFVVSQLGWVLLVLTLLLAGKALVVQPLARYFDQKTADANIVASLLAPAGEFGFVILTLGLSVNALEPRFAQIAIAAMLISMLMAPFLPRIAEQINKRITANDFLARSADIFKIATESMGRQDHVVICGYGRSGQYLSRLLEAENVRFVALDHDPERIREAIGSSSSGNVVFGDCQRKEALIAAGVERARALVVSFADVDAALKIIATAKSIRADLPIVVRTFDDEPIERLLAAGATEVVPEVLEGSLMLASHSLLLLGTPLTQVLKRIRAVREERYSLFQGFFRGATDGNEAEGDARVLHTVTLAEGAWAVGLSVDEVLSAVAARDDAEITVVRRDGAREDMKDTAFRFEAGDALVILGTQRGVAAAELALTR